tara:strand:- start:87 stop:1037 length:951 start_codon:yes stop_codon:yes gene_type:complete
MINKLKRSFKNKSILKNDFINEMHIQHLVLNDFAKEIKQTEVYKIEILSDEIMFHFNIEGSNKKAKFIVDIEDKRSTPLESFNFDTYEYYDSKMLFTLSRECKTIFDIGANLGWYSIFLALIDDKKRILSFEPISETFNALKKNISINNVRSIKTYNLALSDEQKEMEMFYSPSLTGASSFKNLQEKETQTKIIKTNTLDNFIEIAEVDSLDFIKCDVEGAELLVVEGGLKSIEKYKPILFLEMLRKWANKFGYHPNEIIERLKPLNYRCFKVKNTKLSEVIEISESEEATNFFFLDNERHKDLIIKYVFLPSIDS